MILYLLVCPATGGAQDRAKYAERDVKAAVIYNMIKFTDWPADHKGSTASTLSVCRIDDDASISLLESIAGKSVRNKNIAVRHVSSLTQLKDCDVLFIEGSQQAQLSRIVDLSAPSKILTIGDTEGFAEKGVMINLYKKDSRIRFEVNLKALEQAGLKISANVLKLGDVIR